MELFLSTMFYYSLGALVVSLAGVVGLKYLSVYHTPKFCEKCQKALDEKRFND
jgi:hypothetical protein